MLLAGAGLLGLSLQRAMAVSPGFQSDHILTGQILLPWADYPDRTARLTFVESLMDKIGRLPGVLSADVVNNVPFSGNSGKGAATVMGHVLRPGESERALLLRRRGRLLSRHGFLPAGRTIPHGRRFTSLRADLRCG
jgi:hypothetical protein